MSSNSTDGRGPRRKSRTASPRTRQPPEHEPDTKAPAKASTKGATGRPVKAPAKASAKGATGRPVKAKTPAKSATERSAPAKSATATRRDPRTRMVEALLALVGEQGYCDTTVAHVIARAEASRKTFYEHFEDMQSCFLTVGDQLARDWVERTEQAFDAAEEPGDAMEALVEAVWAASLESPAALRLLIAELPAAGAPGIERREWLLGELGRMIHLGLVGLAESDLDRDGQPRLSEDSPLGRVLAGAVLRIPYVRARRGARVRRPRRSELNALSTDVARWVAQYRWAPDPPTMQLLRDGFVPPLGGRAPGTLSLGSRASERRGLPRGESNVSHSFVVHNQRERLLDALVNLSAAKGYNGVTIPEIVQEAAVSVQAFYEHFGGREDAFLVAHEVGQRKALAIVERAYEAQVDWPSAMRAAVGAMLDFFASEPSFAHLAFVDALTAGAKAMGLSRAVAGTYAELIRPGTELIRPGIQYSEEGVQHPEIMVEGAVHGLMELCHMYAAGERARELPWAIDLATHIALDPFLGVGAAEIHVRISQGASHARV